MTSDVHNNIPMISIHPNQAMQPVGGSQRKWNPNHFATKK